MEHWEGATLSGAWTKGPLSAADVLRHALELATALNRFHRQGRVHGRLSPSAIEAGASVLELVVPAVRSGPVTPYTAPEQLSGAGDARSDIFAFGAIVYELATGAPAFGGETEEELRASLLEKEPAPLAAAVPGSPAGDPACAALDRILASCLIKQPSRRRQSMQTVLADLKLIALRSRSAVSPRRPATEEPPRPAEEPPKVEEVALPPSPEPAPAAAIPFQLAPVAGETPAPTPAPQADAETPPPAAEAAPPAKPRLRQLRHLQIPLPEEAAPGAKERRAAMLLSRVGFGEHPGDVRDSPFVRRGVQLKVRTTQQEKSVWVGVLKVAAMLLVVAVIAVVVLAASARLRLPFGRSGAAGGVLHFALPAPQQAAYLSAPAISPDGRLLAFSALGPDKRRRLWLRPLNSQKAAPLAGAEDALAPFWSPDGRNLGFFAAGKLRKIAVTGGPVSTICDVQGLPAGATWNRDGVIVFSGGFFTSLYRVSASGGRPEPVTTLDASRGERAHLWPRFLPDNRHFLLYALAENRENNSVSVGSLDSKDTRRLLAADSNAIYARPASLSPARKSYLVFARGRRLIAQAFDDSKLDVKDDSFTVADDIAYLDFINLLPISASDGGVLAYQSIEPPKRQLVWLDRDGNQTGVLDGPGEFAHVRLSPDGHYAAAERQVPGKDSTDIWLYNLESAEAAQFTSDRAQQGSPVWSPDSKSVAYYSNSGGQFDLYRKPIGGGDAELLLSSGEYKSPTDFSPHGNFLLFASTGANTGSDLWLLPFKQRVPVPYLQTPSAEDNGSFAPDGKWIAYQSDETGRAEVYVEPFPRAKTEDRRFQISTDGGGLPRWREDAKEIYYMRNDGAMMAVAVSAGAGFAVSAPSVLFRTRALPRAWNLYDVSPDGRRFLVNLPLESGASSPISVVSNWTEGFKP